MNAHHARREACFHSAMCLLSAVQAGWEPGNAKDGEPYREGELDRVMDEIDQIIHRLLNRSQYR